MLGGGDRNIVKPHEILVSVGSRSVDASRSRRWVVAGLLALVLAVPAGASAAAGPSERATAAVPTVSGDQAATRALLDAEYELLKATLAGSRSTDAAVARAAKVLGDECRGALRGVPDESVIEEEPPRSRPRFSGRVQGERARSEQEKRTIDLEIDKTIAAAGARVLRGSYDAYIATADRLTWSDPTITALVHQGAMRRREELEGPPVAACTEMRAWAASRFHRLPPGSKSLEEAEEARSKQALQGNLETLLGKDENSVDRVIARRTTALRERLVERELDDEGSLRAWYHLELALGEKLPPFAEQRLAPVIAKGRTNAGTTFVIRVSVHKGLLACRHEVDVEVRERLGGSGSGVCLSEHVRTHPSSSCSGPVETVQFATPPDVRRVRVWFSNGRTVTVSIVQVPARDGGPAGVFIDAFRGYRPYPISVRELNRDGRVLRTVGLRRLRCRKASARGAPGPPRVVNLTTVSTPLGEPLTISATLLHFRGHTEFSLGPQVGMRNSELSEEDEDAKSKQFQWNLSTECAPHPYSLLDGILVAPGASVLVRTPGGLIHLTKVELAASTHAGGPLFYGIYTTTPTEIVVQNSEGSTLYTESLAAKATEETEFCKGYDEQ
jgi:hypothetical protein